jgi:hypothetical protein
LLEARIAIQVHPQRLELRDVYFFNVAEVWDAALRGAHALRDHPAHADDFDFLGVRHVPEDTAFRRRRGSSFAPDG